MGAPAAGAQDTGDQDAGGQDDGEPGGAAADPALDWSNYEKITLTTSVGEPIGLAVMEDGRILHTARNGDVRLTDPAVGTTTVVNTLDVYSNSEDGLQGIALDPGFADNGWVYVIYAPREMSGTAQNGAPYPEVTPEGNAPDVLPDGEDESYWDQWLGYNQLSRFRWDPEADSLDLSSEQVILKVEVQRGQCCHVGGDIDFDDAGNLYLTTGDNTPAGAPGANGFAPNNDAPGYNPGYDSRRGAGNTNDLRGAILRIRVEDDGTYSIPDGNLFEPGTAGTRPELFVMGLRNPFRFDVDPATNSVSWGDYGPDSGVPDPDRGPKGYVEWQTTGLDQPINGGWPYCTGDNFDYNEWDFENEQPREFFDCAAGAENNSRWNTGLDVVPPAVPADLYYGDEADEQPWPELTELEAQGGQGPMGGPVYHHDDSYPDTALPAYWDDKVFFYEFSQDYIAALTVEWPDGPVADIEHFLPNLDLSTNVQPITDSPIDMEVGPEGSLYVLDYGDGFFSENPDAGLYRINYAAENKTPRPAIDLDTSSSSEAPLTVTFDGSATIDPDGDELTFDWDFDGDGTFEGSGVTAEHTYTETGAYTARLRVTDARGRAALTSTTITVGNVAPTLLVDTPSPGAFFDWGDSVPFEVTTSDPEDGDETVCDNVSWTFGLGHDQHAHPLSQGDGCEFAIATPVDAPEHGETENIFGVVVVRYTDQGAAGIEPATSEVAFVLNPKSQEAEWADETSGVEIVGDPAASGFDTVGSLDPGDWLAWDPVDLVGIDSVTAIASGSGELALRWNDPGAEPFATIPMDAEGLAPSEPVDLTGAPAGPGVLYVTSTGGIVLDAFEFAGDGVADVTPPVLSVETDPAEPNGPDGAFVGPVAFTITADDVSDVTIEYSTDGGATWNETGSRWGSTFCEEGDERVPCVIDEVGTTTLRYRATDAGGNESEVGELEITIVEGPTAPDDEPDDGEPGDSGTEGPGDPDAGDPDGAPADDPAITATMLGTFAGELVATEGHDAVGAAAMVVMPDATTVRVDVAGLAGGEAHQAHLHDGACGDGGAHHRHDPDGPSAPPNELWLVDDPADPDAGFLADDAGAASVSGSAPWAAPAGARAVMVHGGELGLPVGCATLDTAVGPVEVVLDHAEVDDGAVEVSLDGGEWATYEGPITVAEPGAHTVAYRPAGATLTGAPGELAFVVVAA
ncbi:MAG: PQQ-dependent sugar dehydrogenase [Actinomycetota bacterium]|nr:PQQ-dependent sugar dehydrogenase [Actinomycetota bacterium]